MVDGVYTIHNYPVRTCTEEDFALFYPVEATHKIRVEAIKE